MNAQEPSDRHRKTVCGAAFWIVFHAVCAVLTAFAWLVCFPVVFESSTLANEYDFHPIALTTTQSVFNVVTTQFALWAMVFSAAGVYCACLSPYTNRARDLARIRSILVGLACVFGVTLIVTIGTFQGHMRNIAAREQEFATKLNDFYCETRTLDVCIKGDRLEDLLVLVGDGTTGGNATSAAVPLASWLRCRNVMVKNKAKVGSRQRAFLADSNVTHSADSWCGKYFQNAAAATTALPSPMSGTPYEINPGIFRRFTSEWPTRLLCDTFLLGVVLFFTIALCWCLTTLIQADGFEELVQDAKFAQRGAGMIPVATV